MKKTINTDSKFVKYAAWLLILIFMIVAGCSSDDDEGIIQVCNLDTDEFVVELRWDSDDSIVDSFQLGEWYDFNDSCDKFEDIEEGRYYIAIYEEGSDEELITNSFYLDDGEYESFTIDDDGDIDKD
ncbi:hypothetical protein QUF70_12765 [Desulfobacterales bacterium HSG17]|nr:hypothetical protein [Desulfobacterales bacterium HSG17]